MPGMLNSLECRACHNLGHAGHAKIGLWHALNAQVIILLESTDILSVAKKKKTKQITVLIF